AVAIRDAAFTVHAGEIVGVAAVEGAGQRELLKALAGRLPPESGVLRIPASVGYVPAGAHPGMHSRYIPPRYSPSTTFARRPLPSSRERSRAVTSRSWCWQGSSAPQALTTVATTAPR